jgi:hypothetical protein
MESYFTFVAGEVFNEDEIRNMKTTLFKIDQGTLTVANLYRTIYIIHMVSGLLAAKFCGEPVSEATAAEVFLGALDPKIEILLKLEMDRNLYAYNTDGILRWFRKQGEIIEKRLYPNGFSTKFRKFNMLFAEDRAEDGLYEPEPEPEPGELEDEHLSYAQNSKFAHRRRRKDQSHFSRTPQNKIDSFNSLDVDMKTEAVAVLQQQMHEMSSKLDQLCSMQGNVSRPLPNPSLVSPSVPHETRKLWFREKKCVNCGDANHQYKACTKPIDKIGIDKVFRERLTNYNKRRDEAKKQLTMLLELPDDVTSSLNEVALQPEADSSSDSDFG